MKFIHISDLHIGKRLNEYSLIKEQEHILGEIINIINKEAPDCVLIAGDVYDKSVPSAEAVSVLDKFLGLLAATNAKIFMISGNHDSAERIAYGTEAFKRQGIYISPVFDGTVSKVELRDEYGKVNIYLLPFIKPAHVKRYTDDEIETYTDAVSFVIKSLNVNESERNVILAHQFVTGAERTESEEVNVGGLDNVEGYVFAPFDYVALGHIHRSQAVGRETMRYSGTPLKYSASEAKDEKSVIIGKLKEKGTVEITHVPLVPMRDYVDIKGKLEEVLKSENKTDFVRITLTDEEAVVDAYGKLKENYPYMTELVFERRRAVASIREGFSIDKSPMEQFSDFYTKINGRSLTDEQKATVNEIFDMLKEGQE
ncbi:MAG: exonuclease SbcCD subunit D [Clostridia bacterium]|nr:exonuclease SbcCD subunit D [Clostridia bacterium]